MGAMIYIDYIELCQRTSAKHVTYVRDKQHMCIYIYIHMYVCMYVNMCIYIYIYIYISCICRDASSYGLWQGGWLKL